MLTHSQSIGSLGSFANLSFGSVDGSTWQNFNQLSIGSLASLTQMISLDLSARSDPSLGQNGSPSSSPTLSRRSLSSPPLLVLDPSHPRSASPTPLYIPVGSAVGANVAVPAALLAAVSLPVSPVSPLSPSDERLSLGPDPLSPAGQRLLGPRLSISTSELNSAVAAAGGPLSPVQAGSTGVREVRMGHAIPHRFSLVRSASMPRCEQCARRVIGVANRFLQCDDCGAVFHKRCGSSAPTSCGIPKELRRYLFPPAGRARGALRPVSLSSSHSSIASAGAGAANEVSSSSLARHFQEAHSTAPEATGNSVAAAAATSQTQASSSRNGSHELFRRASLFPLYTRPSSQHGLQHHGHKDDSHLPNSVGGSVDSGAHGLGSTQQQFQPQPLHQRSTSLKIALSSSGAGIHGRRGKRELPVAGPVPPSVSGVPAGDSGSGGSKAGKSQHTSIADPAATAGKEEKEGKMNVASKGATVLQVGSDLAFEKSSTERETAFSSSETVVEPTS
ncbi:hypothetical protein DFJ73DRAFT_246390 [Zopfochytrium polystomum]|nr:hypothetical protein DFJ73DRAFT_246390 [Zopfochytrium polystomum]